MCLTVIVCNLTKLISQISFCFFFFLKSQVNGARNFFIYKNFVQVQNSLNYSTAAISTSPSPFSLFSAALTTSCDPLSSVSGLLSSSSSSNSSFTYPSFCFSVFEPSGSFLTSTSNFSSQQNISQSHVPMARFSSINNPIPLRNSVFSSLNAFNSFHNPSKFPTVSSCNSASSLLNSTQSLFATFIPESTLMILWTINSS
jgi:hypothetical protein